MKKYDVIVIGSGSANIIIDEALSHGHSCAMIENGKFGGTCLTRGCIPTKVMVGVADFIRHAEHAEHIGITIDTADVNFEELTERVSQKINTESNEVKEYYKSQKNLNVYEATAKFVSNKEIKVIYNDKSKNDEIITGDIIVIGAGARTKVPKIYGLDDIGYVTSETFFGEKFPNKPYESLTVVGGGYIGMEFAHIFSALNGKLNVVQHNKYILPKEEREISIKAKEIFTSYGIDIYNNKDTVRAYMEDDMKVLEFKDIDTGLIEKVKSEEIIIASGVMSNADTLDIQNTDIALERGYIRTNEFLETSVENVYAIGDINGLYQFRHKANYEAEVLAHNLFDAKVKSENEEYNAKLHHEFVNYDCVPAVTYTYPQVAHVGLTEKEASEKNIEIEVAKHYYSQTAKGYSLGYNGSDIDDGYVKIIREKNTKKILGVHAIGEESSLLVQPYVQLMNTAPKKLQIINEDIASETTKLYRKSNCVITREPYTTNLTDRTMVAHPSLSEVGLWTKYMEFK